jgi:hypothetical protein
VPLRIYRDDPPSDPHYREFVTRNILARLRILDARVRRKGLASLDPTKNVLIPIGMEIDRGRVARNGYGAFSLAWESEQHPEWPDRIRAELDSVRERVRAAHRITPHFVLWIGPAEDVAAYQAAGLLKSGPRPYVIDNADPATLKAALEDMRKRAGSPVGSVLKGTLAIVPQAGASDRAEAIARWTVSLYEASGIDPTPNFLCGAPSGSPIPRLARERGYRVIEFHSNHGPLDTSSLLALGLAGADLGAWIRGARLDSETIADAWRLAAFLHTQGEAGRDKITLLLPKPWQGAALWTKQIFEAALGKSERLGLKMVIGERVRMTNYRPPRDSAQDRVFLAVHVQGVPNPDAEKVPLIRRAGYPTAALNFAARTPLSAYMQFICYTMFGVAYLRRMNFISRPGVESVRGAAARVRALGERAGSLAKSPEWKSFADSPWQAKWRGSVTLHYDCLPDARQYASETAPDIYAHAIRARFRTGAASYAELTFFGDMRHSARGRALRVVLDRAAERLFRARLKVPVDIGEAPATEDSSREMMMGHGKCFSTLLLSGKAEDVAGAGYTAAHPLVQFLGTQIALAGRQRPVVAITLRDLEERTLGALDEFFQQAARGLKA